MVKAVLDNDVLIKGASYRLLEAMSDTIGGGASVAILAVGKFVALRRLERRGDMNAPVEAASTLHLFLQHAILLEPSADEVQLATAIEEAALAHDVALDSGESQLFAIAITRGIPFVITGDKRAI